MPNWADLELMISDKSPMSTLLCDLSTGSSGDNNNNDDYGRSLKHRRRALVGFSPDLAGNRCGHNPKKPRIGKPAFEGPPKVIAAFISRMNNFYWNPGSLPALCYTKTHKGKEPQTIRTELRESIILVLAYMVSYLDIPTMIVRDPRSIGPNSPIRGIPIYWIAKHLGISITRVERAVRHLRACGILTTDRRFEFKNGEYRGYPALRSIDARIFNLLGLSQSLRRSQDAIRKKQKRMAESFNASNFGLMIKSALNKMGGSHRKVPALSPKRKKHLTEDQQRQLVELVLQCNNDAKHMRQVRRLFYLKHGVDPPD